MLICIKIDRFFERKENFSTKQGKNFAANDVFMDEKVKLFGKEDEQDQNEEIYLEVEEYEYPFTIELPAVLPTSFEHPNGYIKYSVRGHIDVPWAFDKNAIKYFSVVSDCDLNANPELLLAASANTKKVLCCGMITASPIMVNLEVFKTGYVPGESIKFKATVNNSSTRQVKEMTFSLVQQITLLANGRTKEFTREVNTIVCSKRIDAKSRFEWKDDMLTIPPVCSTLNNLTEILEVSYLVCLNFDATGISISTNLGIPVIIGTVPLKTNATAAAAAAATATGVDVKPLVFSYEPCTFMEKELTDSDVFVPLYPLYNFEQ